MLPNTRESFSRPLVKKGGEGHIHHVLCSAGLVNLRLLLEKACYDIKYATTDNFTGVQQYKYPLCYIRKEPAQMLQRIQRDLQKQRLRLMIWDAYRPFQVQKIFWNILPDERYIAKVSNHNRGITVDVTLVDILGNQLSMPTGFDDFSIRAHASYEKLAPEAKQNRAILKYVMEKHGFTNFKTEWWHFDYLPLKNSTVLDIPL